MAVEPDPLPDLGLVRDALGSAVAGVSVPGWGDRGATYRLDLADGRRFGARRSAGATGQRDAHRIAAVMVRLAGAGLPVPSPNVLDGIDATWLLTPWIDGDTGAAWLGDRDRARHLADRMGRLAKLLSGVDPGGLGLDANGTTSATLARTARSSLRRARSALDKRTRAALDAAVDRLDANPDPPAVFAHGDFAPINVILDTEGEVVALLDLEHARVGSPLLDAAWWSWVVRHHHPDAWSVGWRSFATAADIDPDGAIELDIRALQLTRLLESVALAVDDDTRSRWIRRLTEAAAW